MYNPVYTREEEWIVHRYELESGNVLRFAAQDVHKERSGVHAKVGISINWVTLAWTAFNVERDEDRVRLANSAYGHMDSKAHDLDRAEFPKNVFKHALDLFCMGLWDEFVGESVGELMSGDDSIPPARLLLDTWILKDGGTILFAPPGQGKSYTALAMAVSLAWGVEKIWPVHEAATPLYINVERSRESMKGRLALVNKALGRDAEDPIPFLNARGRSLSDIYEAARRTIKQQACSVVFYDSISRAGFGSLVKDDVANQVMDMLNSLSPSWFALAHAPRADEGHVYGSQMFDAAADLTVQLKAQTSADKTCTGIGLQTVKANDLPASGLKVHVLEWQEKGLAQIRRARKNEFSELTAGERLGLEEEIAKLLSAGNLTATAIAESLGKNRSYVARLLGDSDQFQRINRDGKEVFYGLRERERVSV